MSVFNGGRFLRRAVDGVLAQTFRDFEFIIVDDASTDDTAEILKAYSDPRIVFLKNDTNVGLTAALNRALAVARGNFIARQDADDVSYPARFALQLAAFWRDPELVLLGSGYDVIDEHDVVRDRVVPLLSDPLLRWILLFTNPFAHTAVVCRADVLRQNSLRFDELFATSQDYEFWTRLSRYGRIANLPQALVARRNHPGQIEHVMAERQKADAARVSVREINRRGMKIDSAGRRELLRLMTHFPARLDVAELKSAAQLLRLLSIFHSGVRSVSREYSRYRKDFLWKFFHASRHLPLTALVASRLLPHAALNDPLFVAARAFSHCAARIFP